METSTYHHNLVHASAAALDVEEYGKITLKRKSLVAYD
jgi:hypothetical protein